MSVLITSAVSILSGIDPAMLSLAFAGVEGGELAVFIILLAGPVYFAIIYGRYRNKGKRHIHEKETPVRMSNLQSYDQFYEHLVRQRSGTLRGANYKRVEGSLVQGGSALQSLIDNSLKRG